VWCGKRYALQWVPSCYCHCNCASVSLVVWHAAVKCTNAKHCRSRWTIINGFYLRVKERSRLECQLHQAHAWSCISPVSFISWFRVKERNLIFTCFSLTYVVDGVKRIWKVMVSCEAVLTSGMYVEAESQQQLANFKNQRLHVWYAYGAMWSYHSMHWPLDLLLQLLQPFYGPFSGTTRVSWCQKKNFWTLWCKGRLTEADTLTIQLGATPSGLS